MNRIVFATTNPGKFAMVKDIFTHYGIELLSLQSFNINLDVEEAGETLEENAKIKAEAYAKLLPPDCIVIADDTGVEIDALGGEPGIKVKRWKGYKTTDEEIIQYCLERMKDVPVGERGAQFRTVLAVVAHYSQVTYFDGILRGEILLEPLPARREGMPFWPIFFIPQLNMTLGQFHDQPIEFQVAHPTHRELAILKVLPFIKLVT